MGGIRFELMTSAMSALTPSKKLKSYLNHLTIQGLSVNYVNKVDELLASYIEVAIEISTGTA